MRILIVDDSITMLRLIEKICKEIGYDDLVLCESAKGALDILKEEKLDLVLLDWHMPEMNGFELLQILKSNTDLKSIPVIMLTVEDNINNISRAIENGAEGYILKPVNKEVLLTRLKDIETKHTLGLKN